MKRKIMLAAALCLCCLCLALAGCEPQKVPVQGLTLDRERLMVTVGESQQLTASISPEDASEKAVTWKSADPAVASVEDGRVKGLKEGQTRVTAESADGGFKAECEVTVVPDYDVEIRPDEWETDRTEPLAWKISNGWISLTTKPEPNNDWYSWQGKKAASDMKPTTEWMVSTRLELTEQLLARDGVRTSMWLNVTDGSGKSLDWAILQYVRHDAEGERGWQYWNSSEGGSWVDIEDVAPSAGVHDLSISFDRGTVSLWIDARKAASYQLDTVSAVKEIIFNSYSFGQSYEVRWELPRAEYNVAFDEGTRFASDEAGLRRALEEIGSGKTLMLSAGTYELSAQILLNKNLTLEGLGEVVLTPGETPWVNNTGAKGPASVVLVMDAEVTLKNLTVTGGRTLDMTAGKDYGHGLNAVNAKVTLENVTLTDNAACGIVANSSDLILKNVRTSGNGWAGVNADSAAFPDRQTTVTVDEDTVLGEPVQIYADNGEKVTVTGEGYTASEHEGKTVWTKLSPEAVRSRFERRP